MGKVIYDISMSLDGFIAGANARPEAGWGGLGDGGERLHDLGSNSTDPRNLKVVESWAATGASIFGRTTYNNSILNWGADGPTGARLIEDLAGRHVELETTEVIETKEAIHLRFRVIK